jgi:hypothetical protein
MESNWAEQAVAAMKDPQTKAEFDKLFDDTMREFLSGLDQTPPEQEQSNATT